MNIMQNTYTWIIESLNVLPSYNGQNNVVTLAHWRVNGTDGIHNVTAYGTCPVNYAPGMPFTAYANLTEDTVIKWLWNEMGAEQKANVEASLDAQITSLLNPPIVTPPLPWGNGKVTLNPVIE